MTEDEKKEFEEFLKWKSERESANNEFKQQTDQIENVNIDSEHCEEDKNQESQEDENATPSIERSSIPMPIKILIALAVVLFFLIWGNCNNDSLSSPEKEVAVDEVYDEVHTNNELQDSPKNKLSQAERDSIFNAMKSDFVIKKDEFSTDDASWVEPKTAPKYRNQNALYCCFMMNSDKTVYNMRFIMQYEADSWLFVDNCVFNIDGKNINYTPQKMERDSDTRIWEWFDERVDGNNSYIVRMIANAKKVKIKLNGRQYYDTRNVKTKDISSIKKTLEFYEALGGTY